MTSTGLDLFSIQQEIKAYLQTSIPQFQVNSGAVPNAQSLPFADGKLNPYVILRFTQGMPYQGHAGSFSGPGTDEYYSFVDAMCVGETDDDARELANLVDGLMVGHVFNNTNAVTKNFGGGTFAVINEARRNPVAFITITAFRFSYNLINPGAVA